MTILLHAHSHHLSSTYFFPSLIKCNNPHILIFISKIWIGTYDHEHFSLSTNHQVQNKLLLFYFSTSIQEHNLMNHGSTMETSNRQLTQFSLHFYNTNYNLHIPPNIQGSYCFNSQTPNKLFPCTCFTMFKFPSSIVFPPSFFKRQLKVIAKQQK